MAVDIIRSSHWGYVLIAFLIFLGTTWLMAWRWGMLLAAKGVHEPFSWLLDAARLGQSTRRGMFFPTAVGPDAVRIIEHALDGGATGSPRRPPGRWSCSAWSAGGDVYSWPGFAAAAGLDDDDISL